MDSSKAVVACINGSTGTLTVDANAQATTATSGTSFTAPSVTTSGANRLVLRFFPMVGEFSSRTWTPPTSHTEQLDADSCEIASIIQASSGATGTGVATSSGPGAAVTAVTVAVAGPSGAFFTTSYAVVGTPVLAKLNIGVVTRKVTAATVLGRVQAPAITRRVVVNAIVSRLVPGQLFQKTWTAVVTPIVTAIRSLLPSAPVPGLMTLTDAAVTRSRMSDLAVTTMTLADTPVE